MDLYDTSFNCFSKWFLVKLDYCCLLFSWPKLQTEKNIVYLTNPYSWPPRWCSGKKFICQYRKHKDDPWVGKIPWSRKWQPTLVFLMGKFYGQRSLVGYSPWGCKELATTEHTHTQAWNGPLCPIRNQLASRSWTRLFLLWFQKGEQRAICELDRWVYFSIVVGRTFKTITVVQNSNEQWVTILLRLDIVRWSEIWWRTIALDSKGDFSFQSRILWFK